MHCPGCLSPNLRSSPPRWSDFPSFLVLRFPIRCKQCWMRFSVWLPQIHSLRRMESTKNVSQIGSIKTEKG